MSVIGKLNDVIIILHDAARKTDNPAVARILRHCADRVLNVLKALRRIGVGHDT